VASPEIRLIFCLRRRPELTREEFQAYWLNRHADIMRRYAPLLNVASYTQLHTVHVPELSGISEVRGTPEAFDGVAEACFETLQSILATRRDPAAAQALKELMIDEGKFIDFSRSPIFITRAHKIVMEK
jgi:hypothetical protein